MDNRTFKANFKLFPKLEIPVTLSYECENLVRITGIDKREYLRIKYNDDNQIIYYEDYLGNWYDATIMWVECPFNPKDLVYNSAEDDLIACLSEELASEIDRQVLIKLKEMANGSPVSVSSRYHR